MNLRLVLIGRRSRSFLSAAAPFPLKVQPGSGLGTGLEANARTVRVRVRVSISNPKMLWLVFGIDSVLGLVFFRLPDVISLLKSGFPPVSRSFLRVPVADTRMPTRGDYNLEDLSIAGQSNSVCSALSALVLA